MPAMSREASEILFLLGEMRRWVTTGRATVAMVGPLYDEYAARMTASGYDVPPLPGAPKDTPEPWHGDTPIPARRAWSVPGEPSEQSQPSESIEPGATTETTVPVPFSADKPEGERADGRQNLSVLQVVGSILLVGGVFSVVAIHWATIGSWILPWLLLGISLGLTALGGRQEADGAGPTARVLRTAALLLRPAGILAFARTYLGWEAAASWTLVGALVSIWSTVAVARTGDVTEWIGCWMGWSTLAVAAPMAVTGAFQPVITAGLLAASLLAWIRLRSAVADAFETGAWWTGAAVGFFAMQAARDPNARALSWLAEAAVDGLLVAAVATTAKARDSRELHRLAAILIPAFTWTFASAWLARDPAARLVAVAGMVAGVYLERSIPGQRSGRFAWYGAAATLLWVDFAPRRGPDLGVALATGASLLAWAWLRRTGTVDAGASIAGMVAVRGLAHRVLFGLVGPVSAGIAVDTVTMAGLFLLHDRRGAAWSVEGRAVFGLAAGVQGWSTLLRVLDQPNLNAGAAALQAAALAVALAWRGRPAHLGFAALAVAIVSGTSDIGRAHPVPYWIALGLLAAGTALPGNPHWTRMLVLQGAAIGVAVLSADRTVQDLLPTVLVATGLLAHRGDATVLDRSVALATGCLPVLGLAFMEMAGMRESLRPLQWVGVGVSVAAPAFAAARRFPQAWFALAVSFDLAAIVVERSLVGPDVPGWLVWAALFASGVALIPWTRSSESGPDPDGALRERTLVSDVQLGLAPFVALKWMLGGTMPGLLGSVGTGIGIVVAAARRRNEQGLIAGVAATLIPANLGLMLQSSDAARLAVSLCVTAGMAWIGLARQWRACTVGSMASSIVIAVIVGFAPSSPEVHLWIVWGIAFLSGIGLSPWKHAFDSDEKPAPALRERMQFASVQQILAVMVALVLFVGGTTTGFLASIVSGAAALLAAGHRRSLPGLVGGVFATLLPPNIAYLDNRLDTMRLFVLLVATVATVAVGMTRRWRACVVGGLLSAVVIVHGLLVATIGDGAMAATAAVVGLAAVLAGVRIEALRRGGQLPGWLDPRSEWV